MRKTSGRVTLPAESGQEQIIKHLIKHWGVDAIRDSDGTRLSQDLLDMGFPVYSTICLVRAEQSWPREHGEDLPQAFLMTPRQTFTGRPLKFELMNDWSTDKYRLNENDDPKLWWEVIDRTTGEVVPGDDWTYADGCVTLTRGQDYHEYTVNFLVMQIWDSTSMYNALTNKWTGEKVMSVDPFKPEVYEHLMHYFDGWLERHPNTSVVRLTTLAFMFMLIRDKRQRCCIRDWCGYCEAVTPAALREFEKVKGYKLRGEDFIQAGRYAHTNIPPTSRMLDWMDFIQQFALRFGKDLVDKIHAAGKKAAMFWGDHWIGAEPFDPKFASMGMDIIIGAAEDGVALRRVSDVPLNVVRELRFYPYFFPDVFKPGANPIEESRKNWMKIRRALLRMPVDRIGWGGYLSLAAKFPDFINHLAGITDEFRAFMDRTGGKEAWTAPIRVGVLNVWGSLRSWMVQTGPIEKFYSGREDVMEFIGTNIAECLAGLPVKVGFISFDEILKDASRLNDFDVIINEGFMGSAWSGGDIWKTPALVAAIRRWVHNGGGFIGIGHPSAAEHEGRVFQLADVLGVDLETGKEIQISEAVSQCEPRHFILADAQQGRSRISDHSYVFSRYEDAAILDNSGKHVHIAAKITSGGRGVYISSLPFDWTNARLLQRAIFWSARKEQEFTKCHSSNPATDLAWYPSAGVYCIVNNTNEQQTTDIYDHAGQWLRNLSLAPNEMVFVENN
ncbi:MAG: 1,3-beta-galactosyl-N-acetylhexosamine phosphorylase [Planctomycetes bacterium]|jgi:1,3-beta-galactosyl-N-acetylhexosamine phosphorylase|nr:1,3-beta-galactosyl-N-acetylhexosamine phosphorylase [Planctomycetota bacterium]